MKGIYVELLTAFFGSLGFALLFGLRKGLLFAAALGGMGCWGVYLAALHFSENLFLSGLLAAAFVGFFAEFMARVKKAPATIFLVPSVVPLIPGSSLYYTMSNAVQGKWTEARSYGSLTIQYALSIAAGMSLVLAFSVMVSRIRASRKN